MVRMRWQTLTAVAMMMDMGLCESSEGQFPTGKNDLALQVSTFSFAYPFWS
jgi:hypothetical protein